MSWKRAFSTAVSKTLKSNLDSSRSMRSSLALVVGLRDITAQYSWTLLENSSVPISRAISMISCLSVVLSGRRTSDSDA